MARRLNHESLATESMSEARAKCDELGRTSSPEAQAWRYMWAEKGEDEMVTGADSFCCSMPAFGGNIRFRT